MVNYISTIIISLAIINLTSITINADRPTKSMLRRNDDASKSGKGFAKTSKDGSMRMLLQAFHAPEEPRKLYSWQHEVGDTKHVQTDCEEVVTGYPEVCILFCTEVTTVMKGEQIMDEYSRVSQHKCEGYDDEDGWQSGGLVFGSSDSSKSSKSKSVGFGSGSSPGSKSSKSKSGGSGSSSGSKSSKSKSSAGSGSSKSSKSGGGGSGSAGSGYSKSSKGLGLHSKSSKSGSGGSDLKDIPSEWGTTIAGASPNDWSASWSNGYHHYSNPNTHNRDIVDGVDSAMAEEISTYPTYSPTNDEPELPAYKPSQSVFPEGHPLHYLSVGTAL